MSRYQLIKIGDNYAVRSTDEPSALYNKHLELEREAEVIHRACLMSQYEAQDLFDALVEKVTDKASHFAVLRDLEVEIISEY